MRLQRGARTATGRSETRLVIVRGPSGSGKSTIARNLRERIGRGTALVAQDHLRRELLWERDTPGALNISMIDTVARHALDAGYNVVVEGILHEARYGHMLRRLVTDHVGISVAVYLDVPFEETVRRHAGRPQAAVFTPKEMARWWAPDDRLRIEDEIVIGARTTAQEAVDRIFGRLKLQRNRRAGFGSVSGKTRYCIPSGVELCIVALTCWFALRRSAVGELRGNQGGVPLPAERMRSNQGGMSSC